MQYTYTAQMHYYILHEYTINNTQILPYATQMHYILRETLTPIEFSNTTNQYTTQTHYTLHEYTHCIIQISYTTQMRYILLEYTI